VVVVCASWFITFGVGAMSDWLPTYFSRKVPDLELSEAALIMGAVTVIGGIGGSIAGSFIADKLKSVTRNSYFATCALGVISSTIFAGIALFTYNKYVSAIFLLLCELCLWWHTGPTNALIANSVSPSIRGRAFSSQILFIHLGDAVSPTIVGWVSDLTGNIMWGVLLVPIAILFGGLTFLWGWRILPDMDVIKEVPTEEGIKKNELVPLEDVVERDNVISERDEVIGESRDE